MIDTLSGFRVEVIRRVGGLEGPDISSPPSARVIRRVGGLEARHSDRDVRPYVIRRVGGLEVTRFLRAAGFCVIRRVGGLEDECPVALGENYIIRCVGGLEACGRRNAALQLRYPPCRRVKKRPKMEYSAVILLIDFPHTACSGI